MRMVNLMTVSQWINALNLASKRYLQLQGRLYKGIARPKCRVLLK